MTASTSTCVAFAFLRIMRAERSALRAQKAKHGRAVHLPGRWFPYLVQPWESDRQLRYSALCAAHSLGRDHGDADAWFNMRRERGWRC